MASSFNLIICATQRCGSTLIVEDLRNARSFGVAEEYFLPWDPNKCKDDWNKSYHGCLRRASGEDGFSSVKIMANQLLPLERCLSSFVSPIGDSFFPCFASVSQNSSWVYIYREDKVLQAISREMARQTGYNHAIADKDSDHFAGNLIKGYTSDYNSKAKYGFNEILASVLSIVLEDLCWKRFFEQACINPLLIKYEDVVTDSQRLYIKDIASLVSVSNYDSSQDRRMVKMGNALNGKWKDRFFDDCGKAGFRLQEALRGLRMS